MSTEIVTWVGLVALCVLLGWGIVKMRREMERRNRDGAD